MKPNTKPQPCGIVYGYARVSSTEQNTVRQLIALRNAGVVERNIFTDYKSGKDFDRPAWRKLVRRLKTGDQLIVVSIDRFGRNYDEILSEWRQLVKIKRIHIKVLDMPLLDTTTAQGLLAVFIADLVLQILSFVAETERNHIRSRQREGITAAKARGVKFGRPPIPSPQDFALLAEHVMLHKMTITDAAKNCKMSRTTFRRKLRMLVAHHKVPLDKKCTFWPEEENVSR